MRDVPPDTAAIDLADERAVLEVEDAVAGLDGIEAVRLVPGSTRPVDELHVVVTPDRDPKATSRDLQSLLLAGFGIDVDRRVISVVRLGDDAGQRLQHGLPRRVLATVRIEVRGGQTLVTVELLDEEEHIQGRAGPVVEGQLASAAAEATLDAITQQVDTPLQLEGVSVIQVGAERVAVAAVPAGEGRSRDLLTGSAVVRSHEADAGARAVLDATNRLHHGRPGA